MKILTLTDEQWNRYWTIKHHQWVSTDGDLTVEYDNRVAMFEMMHPQLTYSELLTSDNVIISIVEGEEKYLNMFLLTL